jgi:hypothetical protein
MEPLLYSLRAVLRGALILSLSVPVFAQIVAEPDASVFPSGRNAADFSLAVSQPALVPRPVFEFRGIRIGDEMKEAERTFLFLRIPACVVPMASIGSKPASMSWIPGST